MIGANRMAIARTGALLFACGLFAAPAPAQQVDPDAEKARQLIFRIRSSMRQIDTLLLEGVGDAATEQRLAENQKKIEELLDEGAKKADAVVKDIEELIKLGKSQQSSGGGGGGPPPPNQPPGSDGKGRDKPGKERDKSQDPSELPQQPDQAGQKPEDPQQQGGKPEDGKPDPSKGEQRQDDTPPPLGATGEFLRTDLSGRWGMLPPKEAEELQRRSAEDFPQRYRPWMELYFRRVSRVRGNR